MARTKPGIQIKKRVVGHLRSMQKNADLVRSFYRTPSTKYPARVVPIMRRLIIELPAVIATFACMLLPALAYSVDMDSVLTARYDFESASNLGVDTSGHPTVNNGSVTGDVTASADAMIGNSSARFIGNGYNYITVPDADNLDDTNQLTLSFWAKPSAAGVDGRARGILSKRTGWGNQTAYSIYIYTGGKLFVDMDRGDSEPDRVDTGYAMKQQWQLITLVFDGNLAQPERKRVYVDGALHGTYPHAATQIRNMSSSLFVGSLNANYQFNGVAASYDGLLDDLRIYRNALSASEVMALYLHADGESKWEDRWLGNIICADQSHYSGRLLLMDANADWNDEMAILWQWSAAQSADIKPEHKGWFGNPTEVKRVLDGTHVITSASGGGIAMIRMDDKKVVFYAFADGNPHSVEILPDGNLVSASSGNFLTIFCTDPVVSTWPENTVSSTIWGLNGARGVVWDNKLQRLWALGSSYLVRYRYNGNRTEPALEIEATYRLPGSHANPTGPGGGHDLFPVPGTRSLFISGVHVWTFDTEDESFSEFAPHSLVKSVTQKDTNGLVFFMRATERWWSDSIVSPCGEHKKTLPGAQFYKARWWVPNAFDTKMSTLVVIL